MSLCREAKEEEGGQEEGKVGEAEEMETNEDHAISTKGKSGLHVGNSDCEAKEC